MVTNKSLKSLMCIGFKSSPCVYTFHCKYSGYTKGPKLFSSEGQNEKLSESRGPNIITFHLKYKY